MVNKSGVEGTTDMEQIKINEKAQEDDFADAFATADKGIVAEDKEDDIITATKKDDDVIINNDVIKSDVTPADDKSKSPADKKSADAPEDYEQKWKSLQGILKSKDEKYESEKTQLMTELKTLQEQMTVLSEKSGKKDAKSEEAEDDLSEEQKAILAEYEKDFDVVSKMEGLKRERELKALEKRILKTFEDKAKELQDNFTSKVAPFETNLKESPVISI